MALRTPAHNFSVAQKRVGVTSKRRQCSCRTCQTVYCRATAPSSNLRAAVSLPQGGPAGAVGSRRAQGGLLSGFGPRAENPRVGGSLPGPQKLIIFPIFTLGDVFAGSVALRARPTGNNPLHSTSKTSSLTCSLVRAPVARARILVIQSNFGELVSKRMTSRK